MAALVPCLNATFASTACSSFELQLPRDAWQSVGSQPRADLNSKPSNRGGGGGATTTAASTGSSGGGCPHDPILVVTVASDQEPALSDKIAALEVSLQGRKRKAAPFPSVFFKPRFECCARAADSRCSSLLPHPSGGAAGIGTRGGALRRAPSAAPARRGGRPRRRVVGRRRVRLFLAPENRPGTQTLIEFVPCTLLATSLGRWSNDWKPRLLLRHLREGHVSLSRLVLFVDGYDVRLLLLRPSTTMNNSCAGRLFHFSLSGRVGALGTRRGRPCTRHAPGRSDEAHHLCCGEASVVLPSCYVRVCQRCLPLTLLKPTRAPGRLQRLLARPRTLPVAHSSSVPQRRRVCWQGARSTDARNATFRLIIDLKKKGSQSFSLSSASPGGGHPRHARDYG